MVVAVKNRYKPIVGLYALANWFAPVANEKHMEDWIDETKLIEQNASLHYTHADAACTQALQRGMDFLTHAQLPSGEFAVLEGNTPDLTDGKLDSTPFISSFVVHALDFVQDARIPALKRAALRFILENREAHSWTWRYWSKSNWKYGRLLRPDIDDTAVNLIALVQNGIMQGRTADYLPPQNPNGSFPTWLGTPLDGWPPFQTVDGVVNANVAYHLRLAGVPNERLERYLVNLLHEEDVQGTLRHYQQRESFDYAFTRAFPANRPHAHATPELFARIRNDIHARFAHGRMFQKSPFETALAACALLQSGSPREKVTPFISRLLAQQSPHGEWAPASFYVGLSPYYGSRELTTALACEAIGKYLLDLYSHPG